MDYQVVIVGGGPGGLTCGRILADRGVKCLIIEQKSNIGTKVCAGGITWSGLIQHVPEYLIEKSFSDQYVKTRFQKFRISSSTPIIATINREKLGRYMATCAEESGAQLLTSTRVCTISNNNLELQDRKSGTLKRVTFEYLVGADGSSSFVRRHLGLQSNNVGIGIHYQVPMKVERMEWHLDSRFFKNGYGWIFPHKDVVSVGAYVDKNVMPAKLLKANLNHWARTMGFELDHLKPRAELINFDYKGHQFDNFFLIGDAAGLASPLTGEGIYPAIVSAETVAELILNPEYDQTSLKMMIARQRSFLKMVQQTGSLNCLNNIAIELAAFALRVGVVRFQHIEMAR